MTNEQLNKEAERLIELFRHANNKRLVIGNKGVSEEYAAIECAIIHCDEIDKILGKIWENNAFDEYQDEVINDKLKDYRLIKQTLTNKLK